MMLLASPFLGAEAMGGHGAALLVGARSLSLPWVNLGLALSLLLAVASLMVAVLPSQRRAGVLLSTALAVLGGIAGFSAGEACVATHCTILQSFPGGFPNKVRVKVDMLGVRVSEETGFARIPREGPDAVRSVSLGQAIWVGGPLAAGAAAGVVTGLVGCLADQKMVEESE